MSTSPHPFRNLALITLGCTLSLAGIGLAGCDQIEKVVGKIAPPGAELADVVLLEAPKVKELGRWACHNLEIDGVDIPAIDELATELCGQKINKNKLRFSFDVIFDLSNENEKLAIPLVEILLGILVFEDDNLGAVCVSFCDPDDEECTPTANAEDACEIDDAEDVKTPADLVPTVDDLTSLAEAVATGEVDNGDFRVIPAQESVEAHIQFDLGIDSMLDISLAMLEDVVIDLIAGHDLSFDVPYTLDGTLFFTVPELGRHAIGFGPFDDEWKLQAP